MALTVFTTLTYIPLPIISCVSGHQKLPLVITSHMLPKPHKSLLDILIHYRAELFPFHCAYISYDFLLKHC